MKRNKYTDKQQKRDFKLNKTFNVLGSTNTKNVYNPITGLTSVGISTK